jgi:flagellar basal body-associated protein FliL
MSKTSWIIIIIVVALAAVAGIYYFTQQSQQPATGPAPSIPAELQPMA